MKHSIFDYSQEKLIEYGLSIKHLIILNYIRDSFTDEELDHIIEDNVIYVGIQQQKILDDLPILEYGLYHLRHVFSELVSLELIKTKSYANPGCKGSKTYYALTQKYRSMIYIKSPEVLKKAPDIETPVLNRQKRSGAKKSTSSPPPIDKANSITKTDISNKQISKIDNKRLEGEKEEPKKAPKKDLYSKCVQYIMEYTDYFKLQKALVRYLDVLLEIHRSEKKPIYFNMFVGKLNRLSEFPEEDRLEIVELAISNGWKNFYPLNNNSKPSKKRFKDEAVSEHYTEEELANLKKLEEERKANGLQTRF